MYIRTYIHTYVCTYIHTYVRDAKITVLNFLCQYCWLFLAQCYFSLWHRNSFLFTYVRTYVHTLKQIKATYVHMYTVPFWVVFMYQFLPVYRSVLTLQWRRLSLSCSPSQGDVGWCTQREWTLDCGPSFSLPTSWSARKQPRPCPAPLGLSLVRFTLRRNPSTSAAHWQNRQWRRLDSASIFLSEWCKSCSNWNDKYYRHFLPPHTSQ